MQRIANVIWCTAWDERRNEPTGTMRDLGQAPEGEALDALLRQRLFESLVYGWDEGMIVVTDALGHPLQRLPLTELADYFPFRASELLATAN